MTDDRTSLADGLAVWPCSRSGLSLLSSSRSLPRAYFSDVALPGTVCPPLSNVWSGRTTTHGTAPFSACPSAPLPPPNSLVALPGVCLLVAVQGPAIGEATTLPSSPNVNCELC